MTVLGSSHRSCAIALLLTELLSSLSGVTSEIRSFSGRINAASSYIHYSEGYLVAPGYVDLGGLAFTTTDDGLRKRNRALDEGDEGDDSDVSGSTVDIALFHEPKHCSNSRSGCDWTELGIGAADSEGGLRWCCSNDAIDLGFCEGGAREYGRLIVNASSFTGQHRFVTVPSTGKMNTKVKFPKLEEPEQSGKYVLVLANCNDEGRAVMVDGQYTWKSSHGYLPGDMFGTMYFFAALTLLYFALFCFYGLSMKKYEDSIIPIQKWILATIGMGLLEMFFRTGDLIVWNADGTRFWFAMYTGVIVGVLKRAISRCLVVMVSLGWGVIRDTLGDQMSKIIALGIVYVGVSAPRDIMSLFAVTENQTLSIEQEEELFDVVTILTFVVAAIDVTFYMWILDALNGTMQYLENMNQTMKLKRYLRLRCILLISILFAVIWSVFGLVNTYMEESILEEKQVWAIQASWEVNYLFVLVAVSVLWRPNENAKEYAFVMELPSLGDDGELESNAGAMSTALGDDDDDEEENHQNGVYKDDPVNESASGKLQVDDAVDA